MKKSIFYILILAFIFSSCNSQTNEDNKTDKKDSTKLTVYQYPERIDKSNIYEVNIRQYTPEGTFKAFETHIPRLKEMGVDILWLMPIFPISEKNRKGTMGSYYAVADYKKVNPEFGTKDDLRSIIKTAHENDMLVILDWVANHTGWDNTWITEHPDWYTQDSLGNIVCTVGTDWTDVADLNYDNKDMRKAMTDALKYWVKDFDIDGYRCDVAGMVPTDFWNNVRTELDKIKPVFMLAEAEQLDLHEKAFDMGYAWNFHHIMNEIAKGNKNAKDLREYFEKAQDEYPQKVNRMTFTSNHDENSWNGTVFERMPKSYKTFAVLSFVVPGMPLIYSGQEAGLDERLEFFEKDTIEWKEHEMKDLYTKLITLKNENKALWNGEAGSSAHFINTSNKEQIFTFKRKKDDNRILVMMNLSSKNAKFNYMEKDFERFYTDYFSGEDMSVKPHEHYILKPWEYKVLIEKK
ncbi:MAG: alpha-amylase [Bacteroidales bacterium]|nr:alpha-amylase [Bacteroidales bacterium]